MLSVLIVDDEQRVRDGLAKHIPWSDLSICDIGFAESATQAIMLMDTFKPDILITDICMPGMNGIELANNVRVRFPECRIIFISGYSDKEYLKAAIKLKAVSYVEKPVDLNELKLVVLEAVQSCLESKKLKELEVAKNEKLSESIQLLKQRTALSIIYGELLAGEIPKKFASIGLENLSSKYYVTHCVKFKFSVDMSNEFDRIKSQLLLSMSQEKKLSNAFLMCFTEDGTLCIHSSIDSDTNFALINQAMQIKEFITSYIGIKCDISVGVGSVVSNVVELKNSYEEALKALNLIFFEGYGRIITYKINSKCGFIMEENLIESFQSSINNENYDEAMQLIKNFESSILLCQDPSSIGYIRDCYFKFYLKLVIMAEKNALIFEKEGTDYFWKNMPDLETLSEISSYMAGKIDKYFSAVKMKMEYGNRILQIMQYIKDHICDVDISIKKIAEYMHFNDHYLCRYFRKATDMTINDYIISIRMEKAKILLAENRIKISDIANQVGYCNPSNFIKAFRKHTGYTPAEFRKGQLR